MDDALEAIITVDILIYGPSLLRLDLKSINKNMKEAIASFNGSEFYTIFTSHGLPSSVDDKEYRKELEEFSAKLAYEQA